VEQVADAAVHHARGRARRASAPVLPLEQRDAQPAQRGIPRHAAAVDPSADDDQVVHELTPRALSRALRRGPALGLGTGGRSRRLCSGPSGLGSAAPVAPLGSGAARLESRADGSSPASGAARLESHPDGSSPASAPAEPARSLAPAERERSPAAAKPRRSPAQRSPARAPRARNPAGRAAGPPGPSIAPPGSFRPWRQ